MNTTSPNFWYKSSIFLKYLISNATSPTYLLMKNHLFILRSQRPNFHDFYVFWGMMTKTGIFTKICENRWGTKIEFGHENSWKQMGYKIGVLARKIRENKCCTKNRILAQKIREINCSTKIQLGHEKSWKQMGYKIGVLARKMRGIKRWRIRVRAPSILRSKRKQNKLLIDFWFWILRFKKCDR